MVQAGRADVFRAGDRLFQQLQAVCKFKLSCLEEMSPQVEQYSIDEMFLDVRDIIGCMTFEHFGHQLREHVYRSTGLTIGVGMGPTKTLAKAAQWAGKE